MATMKLPVHAIITKEGSVNDAAIATMLAGASAVYSSAGISFELVSSEVDTDAALANDAGPIGIAPMEFHLARQARAIRYPGRIVVYFRPGSGAQSSTWADYIVMAGADAMGFAHEVGHFLHLSHTHSDDVTGSLYATNRATGYQSAIDSAADRVRKAGGLGVFDGDMPIADTPPDPGPPLFQPSGYNADGAALNGAEHCTVSVTLDVDGKKYVLAPDRKNIMSYFFSCPGSHNISPGQEVVVQRAIATLNRRHLLKGAAPEAPAAVVAGSDIHVFARGDDRAIWRTVGNGQGWTGWTSDIGAGTLTSGPAAAVTGTVIHLFARGEDRNILHTFWDGKIWNGWHNDVGSGTFTSAPAAVVTSQQHIHLFARADDRNVWHTFWNGKTWNGWHADIGAGTLTSQPTAIVTAGDQIHVFARGDDRNVWHTYWNGKIWSGWHPDVAKGTLTSGIGAATISGGDIHLFARGDDRAMKHTFWNGQAWNGWHADVASGVFMSGATAIVSNDKALHTFAQGDDRAIHHSFWNGKVWSAWTPDPGPGATFQP